MRSLNFLLQFFFPGLPVQMAITPPIVGIGKVAQQYTTKLVATDAYGNVIPQNDLSPGRSTNFVVQADSSDLVIILSSDKTGATLGYSSIVAAKFLLSIFFCASTYACPPNPSNQIVLFEPGPISLANSIIDYPAASSFQVGTHVSIYAVLKDEYLNNIKDFSSLVVQFSSSDVLVAQNLSSTSPLNFDSVVSGTYTLTLRTASGHLQGSPYLFTFYPGPVDFTKSEVSYLTPMELPVATYVVVKVTTRDSYNNSIPQQEFSRKSTTDVVFDVSPTVTNMSVVYDTNAHATLFQFTTTITGLYFISTSVANRTIESARVQFYSGTPLPSILIRFFSVIP
jgi:hypothetical protein